jgi:hypothetical protein
LPSFGMEDNFELRRFEMMIEAEKNAPARNSFNMQQYNSTCNSTAVHTYGSARVLEPPAPNPGRLSALDWSARSL